MAGSAQTGEPGFGDGGRGRGSDPDDVGGAGEDSGGGERLHVVVTFSVVEDVIGSRLSSVVVVVVAVLEVPISSVSVEVDDGGPVVDVVVVEEEVDGVH